MLHFLTVFNTFLIRSPNETFRNVRFLIEIDCRSCTVCPNTIDCYFVYVQASEEGVHRPPVAGIAGKPQEGAYSIVLAG